MGISMSSSEQLRRLQLDHDNHHSWTPLKAYHPTSEQLAHESHDAPLHPLHPVNVRSKSIEELFEANQVPLQHSASKDQIIRYEVQMNLEEISLESKVFKQRQENGRSSQSSRKNISSGIQPLNVNKMTGDQHQQQSSHTTRSKKVKLIK